MFIDFKIKEVVVWEMGVNCIYNVFYGLDVIVKIDVNFIYLDGNWKGVGVVMFVFLLCMD